MSQFKTKYSQVDVLPMVKHYMDQLNLSELFQKYVPTPSSSLVDYSESLCIICANIICKNKPLYKIQDWVSKYSDGLTEEPIEASLFNDDRLAKSLSALFEADRHSLMTEVSSNAIKTHNLLTHEIHNDSTTVTFIGQYKNQDPDAVQLKHGHNKDFRPDCKQIVFGLNITADGHVPLSFQLFDGNTSDDTTHIPNWNGLRALLKDDFIYIADCKLCSEKNLSYIASKGGTFITLIPKGRNELKNFYKLLYNESVEWEDAYTTESSRKKDRKVKYRTYEASRNKHGHRVIWIHSSSKEEDEKYRREKKIEKANEKLKELSQKLNAYHLKTKKEIQKAVKQICKGIEDLLPVKIITERKQVRVRSSSAHVSRLKSTYKNKWNFKFSIEWRVDEDAMALAAKTDGVFPLITNTDLSACEVLKKYKSQPFLEKRMYTKKTVLEVAPVFLKQEKRIEAMLFLYFIALMIVSLIERKIRLNMDKEKIEKLPILPQKMNSNKPTWNNIRYFFENIHLSEIIMDDSLLQSEVKGATELHYKLLKLLEVPLSAYSIFPERWWRFKST